MPWSKENKNEYNKKYYQANKQKALEYNKKYREENKEKLKEYGKEYRKNYYQANREKEIECSKKYYQENKERRKEYYQKNKEKISEKRRKNYPANKHKVNEYQREKYHTDPCYKLRKNTSRLVRVGLKEGKGGQSMLPYVDWNSYEELKEHIESQFEDWMTWDNYGEWHIDHIKPQSVLLEGVTSMNDPKFRECWSLENLRPLEARENISKGDKIL